MENALARVSPDIIALFDFVTKAIVLTQCPSPVLCRLNDFSRNRHPNQPQILTNIAVHYNSSREFVRC